VYSVAGGSLRLRLLTVLLLGLFLGSLFAPPVAAAVVSALGRLSFVDSLVFGYRLVATMFQHMSLDAFLRFLVLN